ncbi:MAG: hypothetical protein ACYTGI_12095 [Planctomycetota bacterium]|jgi:NADPH-dependent glutamate synthase beta subunit-like oxidoreductase
MSEQDRHFVAVIGGAVSGSVAAEILAEAGIEVAIIEQNERPYGKIEDGLPRWHVHQRRKEYERIDGRLGKENIHFVPCTKLGQHVSFGELVEDWGVSAVLLANGAWRDRPLRLEGAEEHLGKGIEYQNPFIYWFNHKDEKDYDGPEIEVPDGAIVFGGGLASIDVVKVCQLELYGRALRERGVEVEMIEMEKKGIPATCEKHGIDPKDLGIEGCLVLYRRRLQDMPLAQPVPDATPEQMEKTFATRAKLLGLAQKKYLFRIQDKTLPQELIIKDGRVKGVKVIRTEVDGRKATPIPGTEGSFDTDLIISSIGSIPEPIEGIRMTGEVFAFKDWDLGVYDEEHGVFGVGNVVTGQGNIRASLLHAQKVTEYLKENYFAGALGAAGAETVQQHLEKREPLAGEKVADLRGRVKKLQERAGYEGDYAAWIKKVTPRDLG